MIMEDFNDILQVEENSGFSTLGRISSAMREFQRMVLHCRFTDMGYQGHVVTW